MVIKRKKNGQRKLITKFNSQATSSSIEITIAEAPESAISALKKDSLDAASKPAYLSSCTLIGLLGGSGLVPFHISSTRFKLYKKTNS